MKIRMNIAVAESISKSRLIKEKIYRRGKLFFLLGKQAIKKKNCIDYNRKITAPVNTLV